MIATFIPGTKVNIVGHPAFTGTGMVTANPSADAVIVELESGERSRIAVRYLKKPECDHQWQHFWEEEDKLVEICSHCGMAQPPTRTTFETALAASIKDKDNYQQLADSGQKPKECLQQVESRKRQIKWLEEQIGKLPPDITIQLSQIEQQDLTNLERRVQMAFVDAGKALAQIRDRKLYRATHATFEEYCADKFGFSRRHPYRLIEAAIVVENLCPNGTQEKDNRNTNQMCPNPILPTKERQARPLTKLPQDKQPQAWDTAVERMGGKVPSGRVVEEVVNEMLGKPKKVVQLKPQDLVKEPKSKNKQLLPDVERNSDVSQIEPPHQANMVNTAAIAQGKPDVVAHEIALGMRSLTPDQLAWAITTSANYGLSDEHLKAAMKAIKQVLDERHQPEYFTA